jgi:hypothetical protein
MTAGSSDRRDSYRLNLDPGQATVHLPHGPAVELRDLSASGGRLIVRGAGRPELPSLEIELADGDTFRTRPEVVRVRSHESGVFHLGARFAGLGRHDLQKLSHFIARELQRRSSDPARLLDAARSVTVTSPVAIRNVFRNLLDDGRLPALAVVDRQLRLGADLRVEGVAFEEGRRVIRARLVGTTALDPQRSYEFLLGGPAAVTVFASRVLEQRGEAVTLALPTEIRQTGSRLGRRVAPDAALRVAFEHPRLPATRVDGVVLDASDGGLAFDVCQREHGLVPGDRLTTLRLGLPRRTLRARAVIRGIHECAPTGRASCGVELLAFETGDDARAWRQYVWERAHPGVLDGQGRAERGWALLEGSKYVESWTPTAARAHVRKEYVRAWDAVPPTLGHTVMLHRGEAAVAMGAGSVVAPRSWVLHHLACDPQNADARAPLASSYEVIAALLHRLQAETDLEHFIIYLERGKRWNERLYADFVEHYFDRGRLELTSLEVHRRATDAPLPAAVGEPEVVAATPALVSTLARRLAATTTALERRALALDEERLLLGDFSEACRQQGHERARQIFFVVAGGEARAALIAESGSEGVNIFGLLNTCRLVPLTDEPLETATRLALLRRAIEHYRGLGKRHFLLCGQAEDGEAAARLGFEHVSGGLRWIAHRQVIPAWAAYLEGLLAAGGGS